MNRIYPSKEALQTLKTARLDLETRIREAKAITRKPHTAGSGASTAQSQLHYLRKEATLLYSFIARCRGKVHCATSEERLEQLKVRAARGGSLNPTEKLILDLLNAPPAPARVSAPEAASASVAA